MEPDFWHARWAARQIGFHQDEINIYLKRHWHTLGLQAGSRILVPLCGKSLDMLWLVQQGFMVAGIEISPLAVEAFFTENKLQPVITDHAGHTLWSHAGLEIYCGDFFALTSTHIGDVNGVYDRAALIAMTTAQRPAYAIHLAGLLPSQAPGLLVTLDYNPQEMEGPPFAVPSGEVERLLGADFDIRQLARTDALDANPAFRDKGLSRLSEQLFRLVRR